MKPIQLLTPLLAPLLAGWVALATPALAKGPEPDVPDTQVMMVTHFELVGATDAAAAHFAGQNRYKGEEPFADEPGARVVQSIGLSSLVGRESLFHLGRKYPITYYDPRASQFQIQYVDIGVKLDVKVRFTNDTNEFELDVRPEVSTLSTLRSAGNGSNAVSYPQTSVVTTQSLIPHAHPGEWIVVGRVHGPSARQSLQAAAAETAAPPAAEDNLLLVIRIERP